MCGGYDDDDDDDDDFIKLSAYPIGVGYEATYISYV